MSQIRIQSVFYRSDDSDCVCCEGPHIYRVGAKVLSSDHPSQYPALNDLQGHISRAIESFEEGSILVITIEEDS